MNNFCFIRKKIIAMEYQDHLPNIECEVQPMTNNVFGSETIRGFSSVQFLSFSRFRSLFLFVLLFFFETKVGFNEGGFSQCQSPTTTTFTCSHSIVAGKQLIIRKMQNLDEIAMQQTKVKDASKS